MQDMHAIAARPRPKVKKREAHKMTDDVESLKAENEMRPAIFNDHIVELVARGAWHKAAEVIGISEAEAEMHTGEGWSQFLEFAQQRLSNESAELRRQLEETRNERDAAIDWVDRSLTERERDLVYQLNHATQDRDEIAAAARVAREALATLIEDTENEHGVYGIEERAALAALDAVLGEKE